MNVPSISTSTDYLLIDFIILPFMALSIRSFQCLLLPFVPFLGLVFLSLLQVHVAKSVVGGAILRIYLNAPQVELYCFFVLSPVKVDISKSVLGKIMLGVYFCALLEMFDGFIELLQESVDRAQTIMGLYIAGVEL